MKKTMTGGQAIVEILKKENTTCVFNVPGESFMPILDALYDAKDIKLISNRQEGGAAFMAEAYAQASGEIAVVMATRAVGAANLSIGIHTAKENSTPMIVFLGQVKSSFRGRQGFQEVELDQFLQEMCKWTVEIDDVHRIPEIVQRAFRIAKSGRPGPVAISIPEDILEEETTAQILEKSIRPKPRPSIDEVKEFFNQLRTAKKPVIIAGAGITLSKAEANLITFAEKYNIPVLAAFRRHSVFPHDNRLFTGHLGLGIFNEIKVTARQADTIIAIGTRLSEVTTQGYSIFSNEKQKLLHIDIDYNTLGKVYEPTVGIVSDANEALISLLDYKEDNIASDAWKSWTNERRGVFEKLSTIEDASHSEFVDNKQIIRILQKNLPSDAILTNDAGNFSGWLHNYFRFNEKNTYVGATSGAMGYGMVAAIGAKLAHPDRVVVSLSGDGGLMMTIQELEVAVRFNVPIISLVFNNKMFGSIRMFQEKDYPYREIGSSFGNPDFVKLGESFGAFSQRVTCDAEFESALKKALDSNKPSLIEIVSDPEVISITSTITSIREQAKQK